MLAVLHGGIADGLEIDVMEGYETVHIPRPSAFHDTPTGKGVTIKLGETTCSYSNTHEFDREGRLIFRSN